MTIEARIMKVLELEKYQAGFDRAHAHAHKNDGVTYTDANGVEREKRSSTGEAAKVKEWLERAVGYVNGISSDDVRGRTMWRADGYIRINGKLVSYESKSGSGSVKYAKSHWTPFTEADLTVDDLYPNRQYILYNPDVYEVLKKVDYHPTVETIIEVFKGTKVLTRAQFIEVARCIGLKFGNSTRLMINLKTIGKKNRRVFDETEAMTVYDLIKARYESEEGA